MMAFSVYGGGGGVEGRGVMGFSASNGLDGSLNDWMGGVISRSFIYRLIRLI